MTADPSATAEELAHYGSIALHLTGSRRQVLETVARCGPADLDGLTECWRDGYPDETARLGPGLDHLATGLVWKLEALGWVHVEAGTYSATPAGHAALGSSFPS